MKRPKLSTLSVVFYGHVFFNKKRRFNSFSVSGEAFCVLFRSHFPEKRRFRRALGVFCGKNSINSAAHLSDFCQMIRWASGCLTDRDFHVETVTFT